MKKSLQTKANFLFMLMSTVVLTAAGFIGLTLQRQGEASRQIDAYGIPTLRSAQEMLLALNRADDALKRAVATKEFVDLKHVQAAKQDFETATLTYNLFAHVLLMGSDTEAFKAQYDGLLYGTWQRRGLGDAYTVAPAPESMNYLLTEVDETFKQFAIDGAELFRMQARFLRLAHLEQEDEALAVVSQIPDLHFTLQSRFGMMTAQMQELILQSDGLITEAIQDYQVTQRALILSIFVSFVAILLILLISLFTVRHRIIRSILSLSHTAQLLARGELSTRSNIESADEIGVLAKSFNEMAANLQDAQQNLEARVAEQTQQLEQKVTEGEAQKAAILNIMEDLETSRKRTEQSARDAKKFQQAVNAAANAISILSPQFQFIYVNPAWQTLTGYDANEALGTTPELLIHDTSSATYQDMKTQGETGLAFRSEDYIYQRKNKSVYNAEVNFYPVKDDDGTLLFYVSIHEDITKRKRVDAAKSDFVSLASHQLRTPLTSVRWILKMFCDGKAGSFNDKQGDLLKDAYNCADTMSETIGTMLMLSRLEAGSVEPDVQTVNISDCVDAVWNNIRSFADEKKQVFSLRHDFKVEVQTDEKLLREIFNNLLHNAMKYTPERGKITVTVSTKNGRCDIAVTDTGCGIPKEEQAKVFSKFFRAENVLLAEINGTGLGLYLVQSLVHLLRGTISFTSEEGVGTTFTISLPLSYHG